MDMTNEPEVREYRFSIQASADGFAANSVNGFHPAASRKIARIVLKKNGDISNACEKQFIHYGYPVFGFAPLIASAELPAPEKRNALRRRAGERRNK